MRILLAFLLVGLAAVAAPFLLLGMFCASMVLSFGLLAWLALTWDGEEKR